MALPKVCGIETEYGIVVRGAENNPVSASSLLINAYVSATSRKVGWDFDDEHPANDARGFSLDDVLAPEVETTLVNAVLTNGARYYVDHAHPEISTPEVSNAARGRGLGPRRRGDRAGIDGVRPASWWPRRSSSSSTRTTPTARATATAATRTTCWPASSRSGGWPPRSRRTSSPARCSAAPARSAASCRGARPTRCRTS